ncbi:MAG: pseudouridine synthase, partial [Planctomycetota bacterium]
LQNIMAASGVARRRECEQLIMEVRVDVDGVVGNVLGTRADPSKQEIRVDGEALAKPKKLYFAVHKPAGVVCTARDPAGRPRVVDMLPPSVGRVFNVGRLDLASEGLILVTNDGELANRLTHPRHGVLKEYEVQVAGQADPEVLAQLRKGVHLAEARARAVHVRIKSRRKQSTVLNMVLDEGRNREIRRILAHIGHKVQRLTRVAVGPIRLGELPRGGVRRLTSEEIKRLQAAAYGGGDRRKVRPSSTGADPARRKRKQGAAAGKARANAPRKKAVGRKRTKSAGRGRR